MLDPILSHLLGNVYRLSPPLHRFAVQTSFHLRLYFSSTIVSFLPSPLHWNWSWHCGCGEHCGVPRRSTPSGTKYSLPSSLDLACWWLTMESSGISPSCRELPHPRLLPLQSSPHSRAGWQPVKWSKLFQCGLSGKVSLASAPPVGSVEATLAINYMAVQLLHLPSFPCTFFKSLCNPYVWLSVTNLERQTP